MATNNSNKNSINTNKKDHWQHIILIKYLLKFAEKNLLSIRIKPSGNKMRLCIIIMNKTDNFLFDGVYEL